MAAASDAHDTLMERLANQWEFDNDRAQRLAELERQGAKLERRAMDAEGAAAATKKTEELLAEAGAVANNGLVPLGGPDSINTRLNEAIPLPCISNAADAAGAATPNPPQDEGGEPEPVVDVHPRIAQALGFGSASSSAAVRMDVVASVAPFAATLLDRSALLDLAPTLMEIRMARVLFFFGGGGWS